MRAEALNALIVSEDREFCRNISHCLYWAGVGKVSRVSDGRAARRTFATNRFKYDLVVIQILEETSYDVEFIESVLHGSDQVLRFLPIVAVASVRTKEFYQELQSLGFSALVLAPIRRTHIQRVFVNILRRLQKEFRNPDPNLLLKALRTGDFDTVEKKCTGALVHHPGNAFYRVLLGEAAFIRGKFDVALEHAERGLEVASGAVKRNCVRLKVKSLFSLGRKDECFESIPFIHGGESIGETPFVVGLLPALSGYASHLKQNSQLDEAIFYYHRALDEADGDDLRHKLKLNLALALFHAGELQQSLEVARESLDAAGGQFAKAEALIALLEKEHTVDLGQTPDGNVEDAEQSPLPELSQAGEADEKSGASASLTDAKDGFDLDLTEELDFPAEEPAIQTSVKEQESSVFSAMAELGEGQLGDEEPEVMEMDEVGAEFEMDLDLDELDFDVSEDDLQAAREFEAHADVESADILSGEGEPSSLPDDSVLEAEVAGMWAEDGSSTVDSVTDEDLSSGADLPAEAEASLNELLDGDAEDAHLSSLLQEESEGQVASELQEAVPMTTEESDEFILAQLLGEEDDASGETSGGLKSPTDNLELGLDDILAEDEDPKEVEEEEQGLTAKEMSLDADAILKGEVRWGKISPERRLAYVMFEKEFPKLALKPSPYAPNE